MDYTITYAHNSSDTPGTMTREFDGDDAARKYVREFVRSGYRNETWARVDLAAGTTYVAHNRHGEVAAGGHESA